MTHPSIDALLSSRYAAELEQYNTAVIEALTLAIKTPGAVVRVTLDREVDVRRTPSDIVRLLSLSGYFDKKKSVESTQNLWPADECPTRGVAAIIELTNGSTIELALAEFIYSSHSFKASAEAVQGALLTKLTDARA